MLLRAFIAQQDGEGALEELVGALIKVDLTSPSPGDASSDTRVAQAPRRSSPVTTRESKHEQTIEAPSCAKVALFSEDGTESAHRVRLGEPSRRS